MPPHSKAIVLLSGGIDSATTLVIAQQRGFDAFALTFQYGQRHGVEVESACQLARRHSALQHRVVKIDLRAFGGSALTAQQEVPKKRELQAMTSGIPLTYVPARNTIFLSYALAWAKVLDAADIFLGVNALDYGGYPDCRAEYIEAYERMANLATRIGVEGQRRLTIHTPLIRLTKAAILRSGLALGVDFSLTSSCYDPAPAGEACGQCDAGVLRLDGFAHLGVQDPRPYQPPAPVST